MTDRNRNLSALGLAQTHNIYGTLGVMSIEEIQSEIKDIDFARENAIDLVQIHNVYGTLGVMSAEEMRGHLGLTKVVGITEPADVAVLVLKALRQRTRAEDVVEDGDTGVLFVDVVDDAPYWLQAVNVDRNVIEDSFGRRFRVLVEPVN